MITKQALLTLLFCGGFKSNLFYENNMCSVVLLIKPVYLMKGLLDEKIVPDNTRIVAISTSNRRNLCY